MKKTDSTSNVMQPDCLIFDMDGTLWDATESYAMIWNECNKRYGIDIHITAEDLHKYMGKPIRDIVIGLFPNSEIADISSYLTTLNEITNELMPTLGGKLFPGVRDGIIELSKSYPIMIVSNCGANGAEYFMKYFALEPYILDNLTYGATKLEKDKNMRLLMEKHGFCNGFYIGDTQQDSNDTHCAGLKFGFMKYGFGSCNDADMEFENFGELVKYFES